MAPSGSPSSSPAGSASESHHGSKRWAAIKPGLILGLKVIEKALDGLPVPGAKGCVSLIIHFIETADLASDNAEALEALQSRLQSLQELLLPICSYDAVDVPDDVQKDVRNLAKKFDELEAHWKRKLEPKKKKRHRIRRFLNAQDDQETLTKFSNAVGQAIQDFVAITTTNGRIADFREESKNREARALHLLPRAPIASYNSVRNGGANVCLEGTRVSILSTIKAWATSPDPKQAPIFWLNGLAGIGKTTIAHSIASELDAAGLLGASFVFLRADDQLKDARLAFPTIAYQLAQFSSQFRTRLAKILELDPDCASKHLDLQFEKLILQPLSGIQLSAPTIIILDALDECEPEKLTSELLRILLQHIRRIPFLRVFITSRPEGYIRESLDWVDNTSSHEKLVLHEDIYAEEVENDIHLFLKSSLQEIWNKHTRQTHVRWPSGDDLDNLVKQSGKLFVYAATAVRFIGSNRALNLKRQLSTLLAVKTGHVPHGEPYKQLDGLYLQILDSVFIDGSDDYYIQRFRRIVGSIVLLERPLSLLALSNLLVEYPVDEINETLYHFHSIIVVPATLSEAPRTYHLSFPNFITNPDRCISPKAYIDPGQQAKYLFLCCMAVLERDFVSASTDPLGEEQDEFSTVFQPHNTSEAVQVPLVFIQDQAVDVDADVDVDVDVDMIADVDDYPESTHSSVDDDTEDHDLPAESRYADNYWCRHLVKIPPGEMEATTAFTRFIKQYLPKWIQRRKDRISPENVDEGFANRDTRLARDTFDVIRSAHRWAVDSGCSKQLLRLLSEAKFDSVFGQAQLISSLSDNAVAPWASVAAQVQPLRPARRTSISDMVQRYESIGGNATSPLESPLSPGPPSPIHRPVLTKVHMENERAPKSFLEQLKPNPTTTTIFADSPKLAWSPVMRERLLDVDSSGDEGPEEPSKRAVPQAQVHKGKQSSVHDLVYQYAGGLTSRDKEKEKERAREKEREMEREREPEQARLQEQKWARERAKEREREIERLQSREREAAKEKEPERQAPAGRWSNQTMQLNIDPSNYVPTTKLKPAGLSAPPKNEEPARNAPSPRTVNVSLPPANTSSTRPPPLRPARRTSISDMVQRYEPIGGNATSPLEIPPSPAPPSPIHRPVSTKAHMKNGRAPNSSPEQLKPAASSKASTSSRSNTPIRRVSGDPVKTRSPMKDPDRQNMGIMRSVPGVHKKSMTELNVPAFSAQQQSQDTTSATRPHRISAVKPNPGAAASVHVRSESLAPRAAPVNIPPNNASPPPSSSPERPYQGIGKLIDEWQKNSAKAERSQPTLRATPSAHVRSESSAPRAAPVNISPNNASPPPSSSPERPYQGIGKLIDEWQKNSAKAERSRLKYRTTTTYERQI